MTILCLQHSWQGIPAQILLVYGVCRSTKKLFCFFQLELQLLLAAQPGKNSTPQLVVSNFCSIFFYLPKMLVAMSKIFQLDTSFVVLCAIWYHSYNLKNVKNTHGGVLLLVKLQAEACNFTKSSTPPWVFFTIFRLCTWY